MCRQRRWKNRMEERMNKERKKFQQIANVNKKVGKVVEIICKTACKHKIFEIEIIENNNNANQIQKILNNLKYTHKKKYHK